MIDRYTNSNMKKIWSRKARFDAFLKVEKAASFAWYKQGLFDQKTYEKIEQATYHLRDIDRFEEETKHDVIAFTMAASLSLGEEKKYFHYGLTSTDIVDSALGVIFKKVNRMIRKDITNMLDVLKSKAYQYQMTPIMGRTHGMHAELTSFGLKFALWYEDLKRIEKRFKAAAKDVEVCKLSGAVGTYAANHPNIEKVAAKKLGLQAAAISTQTLQRDRHANYLAVLAQIGSQIEKMAVEIRHLSRTEIHEVSEAFKKTQRGSSAMPQKKNPIASENVSGLSRILRGYMLAEYESIALWHERDISHSSVERIALMDATTLVDYMLTRYTKTMDQLVVYPKHMHDNIMKSYRTFYAQTVLHQLIDQGHDRLTAYESIKAIAHRAFNEGTDFITLLKQDQNLSKDIDFSRVNERHYLRYVESIYKKVFER